MRFTVTQVEDYLRGDLYNRVTGEETDAFLRAVAAEVVARNCERILLVVHTSRAIFRIEQFKLCEHLERLASRPGHRVALICDDFEVRLAHQYIASLARIRGFNVHTFPTEAEAVAWLRS